MAALVEALSHTIDDAENLQDLYKPSTEELADMDSFLECYPEHKNVLRGKVLRAVASKKGAGDTQKARYRVQWPGRDPYPTYFAETGRDD